MTASRHFETNRLTTRHGRFTSKRGGARSDTSMAAPCQKRPFWSTVVDDGCRPIAVLRRRALYGACRERDG
jgi:hypothetical protein